MFLKKEFNIAIFTAVAMLMFSETLLAGILVTPQRHILELNPGEEKTVYYEVYNDGEDIHFTTDVKEWAKAPENKDIDIKSWLFVIDKEFDVKSGETKAFRVNVKAPDKAVGEIVVMIYLCYQENKDSPLHIRYGNPLYLVIKGTQSYNAQIEKVGCTYFKDPKRDNRSCLGFLVSLKNTGNIHLKPDIDVNILDKDGRLIKQLTIEKGEPVFSDQSHNYSLEWWDADLPDGIYEATVAAAYEDKIKPPKQAVRFEFKDEEVKVLK